MMTILQRMLPVSIAFLLAAPVALGADAPALGAAPAATGETPLWEAAIANWKSTETHGPANNSFCYVCHLNFQEEAFATTHRQAGVGCETCHGISDRHSEDEDNITPPDVMYAEDAVAPLCIACHSKESLQEKGSHEALLENEAQPIAACTTCHGQEHRMAVRTRTWDKKTGELIWDDGVRMMSDMDHGGTGANRGIFAMDNLVAWCIVPFDAAKRGPVERAEMLARLGFSKLAYDWRDEHVPSFEQEILALKSHGIEFFAFWGAHEDMFRLFEQYKIAPQVWMTAPSPQDGNDEEKVEAAATQLLPLVDRTRSLGCKLGLYNHGGWGGQPRNMVAVCEWLRKNADASHVGIVYNFHHGHDDIAEFPVLFALMKPYLLCVNLNGMNTGAEPLILTIGQGEHDRTMLETVVKSGYQGPIGILDHRPETDSEETLRENLEGLNALVQQVVQARP